MLATLLLAALPFVAPALAPAATPTPPPLPPGCNAVPFTTELYNPPEIRSHNGLLGITLYMRGLSNPLILESLCWWYQNTDSNTPTVQWMPPTLRLRQGDTLELTLVNEVVRPGTGDEPLEITRSQTDEMAGMTRAGSGHEDYKLMCGQPQFSPTPTPDPVTGRILGYHRSAWNETSMHFHGLNVSPSQPSDDVVDVLLCPLKKLGDKPQTYTYVINIPHDEPPGLYWYHPHPHGESERQLVSQLTGAIVVDPILPNVTQQLKNHIVIVRDVGAPGDARPKDPPAKRMVRAAEPPMNAIRAAFAAKGPPVMNFGQPSNRFGPPQACPPPSLKPAPPTNSKELRVNFLPLPAKPNTLKGLPHAEMALGTTEYWRLANTSSDTILDVEQIVNGKKTPIPVASRDGVPLIVVNGRPTYQPVPMDVVRMSPGSRMEFYVNANASGTIVFRTKTIDTGCLGDGDFARNLFVVSVSSQRHAPTHVNVPKAVDPVKIRFSDLAQQGPKRHRYFAFTEYNRDDTIFPDFYITELSNPKAIEHPFAMRGAPDVIVKSGTVEDWTILNYTQELHEFHMHQIHFLVLQGAGLGHGQGQLLDTVDVPYGTFTSSGSSGQFIPGAVTLRMDFRDPSIIGEFVYHCHILAHEDNGMMAKIRVVP